MKNRFEKYSESMKPVFEAVSSLTMIQRILIVVVVFALLIGSFVFFSYMPKYKDIAKIDKQYETVAKELNVAKQKAAQLGALQEEWAEKEEKFKLVMAALPDKKEIPSLLSEISRAGNSAGLEFTRFVPQQESIRDFYAEIPVAISITGPYHSISLFFEKIAEMSRIVNVRGINISASKNAEDTLSTQCTTVTYRFLSPAEQAKTQPKGKKR
ncbi:type IV pilus inner membrane component PilO [Desulfosudis oleivorans]|uniref:Pilus assembly protein PilO n=1 Tax=Desulfosudis oleivorans (strain DSM 6200 / JCM 39069 / Hxd3) TaxID=96561 RepID=A8ZSX7_DESOH|nr:type 4a pilus biogenesis protein PilO [Desulfosudis oleivorans]ABW66141.1 Pilus assembly protein PilO [Desulfosudis oleivorans Hxd3]